MAHLTTAFTLLALLFAAVPLRAEGVTCLLTLRVMGTVGWSMN